jgi:hypothetical protein
LGGEDARALGRVGGSGEFACGVEKPAVAPWATSRSAFINWAAEKKAVPTNAAGGAGGSKQVREFRESGLQEGELGGEDARALGRVGGSGEFACGVETTLGTRVHPRPARQDFDPPRRRPVGYEPERVHQ